WAVHRDGWYGDRFAHTLSNLGFHLTRLEKTEWNILRNITAHAIKNADLSREELLSRIDRLLRDGMVDTSDCEKAKHAIWAATASSNLLRTTGVKEALASDPVRKVPAKQCVCIVFSKDRAMQLDACLRSFSSNCIDMGSLDIKVIYTTSSPPHEDSYDRLRSFHTDVCFMQEHSFKTDLTANLKGYRHIIFVVDDCLFVRPFTIHQAIRSLDTQPEALGYSFRLGRNITYHYPGNSKQHPANIRELEKNTLCVAWPGEEQYFGYPLELSSSLYRTEDICPLLLSLDYNNPNTLEAELAAHARNLSAHKPLLLFPEQSSAFCNPLNIVQTTFSNNRVNSSNALSPETLLHHFNDGLRIRIEDFSEFTPCSCHQDVVFSFYGGNASIGNDSAETKILPNREPLLTAGYASNNCNTQEPFISIAIPAYNSEQYIQEALTSAFNQEYDRFEVLVVDDGSTDATRDIVSSFNDQRLRLIEKEHTGAPDTRNRCVSESRGQYILWLDSDDVLPPGVLNTYVKTLHLFPDIDVMYGDIVRCDAILTPIQAIRYEDWYKRNVELLQALFLENIIPNPGTLVRKQCLVNCGGYDPGYRRAHDYELWSRIAATARFKHVPRIVACWRMHDANLGAGRKNVDTSYEARIVRKIVSTNEIKGIFPDLPWHSPVPHQAEAMACLLISKQLLYWKDFEGSISFVEKANTFLPNDELRKHIENLKHFTGGHA
ncbi:MAG: glycosyltransferase, partial [Geobacteraceae bacterium]|nr:glycosyltransferase [Geobacteraceae bacterium]